MILRDRRSTRRIALLAVFASLVLSAEAQRLPTTVVPENYKLFLDPNIASRAFSGEETTRVRVGERVTEITMNSLDLDISVAEVKSGKKMQRAKVVYDKPAEMVRLQFSSAVPAGNAELHLKFSGKLTEGLRGLYLSKSARRMYAVTQFEGTYARMMFPCFDEPSFKATFDLQVTADKGDTAISNGRIIHDERLAGGARHKITFSTSPRMSTYLVALAIGDWQCLESSADGIPVRVCATPENKDAGRFALDAATHSLQFYNQWYGIKYPFGKLDMVAIPDYEWGGMENTAAIFYRESALLLNEEHASALAKRGHASTIAHEIAHQWFGDLVTAAWWDDIWLNEGFATWMSSKPVEAWHPEWNLEAASAFSAQQIIGLDSLPSARAIHGNPRTSAEIKEMFDGITYEKGAAVLRMLESYVGAEVFRKGVNQYLKEHANGNATSHDFWRAVAEASGKPVDKIMPTFVLQPGVPLLSIAGNGCEAGHTSLQVAQQRFFLSPKPNDMAQLWHVPACIRTDKDSGANCSLISRDKQKWEINGCTNWYFANRDGKGYYRVFYDVPNVMKVADIAEKELNAPERIALLEDAWAMMRGGRYPVAVFMHLAEAMRSDSERLIVSALASHLDEARTLVQPEREQEYDKFVRAQFAPIAQEIGWDPRPGDTDEQKILRATLLSVLGEAGDPSAVAAAEKIVRQYLRQPRSTDGTITGPAFGVAAAHGDAELYQTLMTAFEKAQTNDEYYNYLFALAAFRRPELADRTLQLVTEGKVRQQDYPSIFSALLNNPASRPAAWSYLKSHWNELQEKISSFGGRGAVSALGSFCSRPEKKDVQQFFSAHRAPGAERALQQSLDAMDSCMEFKQLQQANMEKWLASRQ